MSDTKSLETNEVHKGSERRRPALPQPDFRPFEKANAYPGSNYFFVGHSYDTALDNAPLDQLKERNEAIKALFVEGAQCVPIKDAVTNEQFFHVLTRFEQDLLHRLPESSLIGAAINPQGKVIPESFSVWRIERRRPRAEQ